MSESPSDPTLGTIVRRISAAPVPSALATNNGVSPSPSPSPSPSTTAPAMPKRAPPTVPSQPTSGSASASQSPVTSPRQSVVAAPSSSSTPAQIAIATIQTPLPTSTSTSTSSITSSIPPVHNAIPTQHILTRPIAYNAGLVRPSVAGIGGVGMAKIAGTTTNATPSTPTPTPTPTSPSSTTPTVNTTAATATSPKAAASAVSPTSNVQLKPIPSPTSASASASTSTPTSTVTLKPIPTSASTTTTAAPTPISAFGTTLRSVHTRTPSNMSNSSTSSLSPTTPPVFTTRSPSPPANNSSPSPPPVSDRAVLVTLIPHSTPLPNHIHPVNTTTTSSSSRNFSLGTQMSHTCSGLGVSSTHAAVIWNTSRDVAIFPFSSKSTVDPDATPTIVKGHTGTINDLTWGWDQQLITCAQDGYIRIWRGDDKDVISLWHPSSTQTTTIRSLGLSCHPSARDVLATITSTDACDIWNLSTQKMIVSLSHTQPIWCANWSPDGHLLATTSQDRNLRIWDIRSNDATHVIASDSGKTSRVVWIDHEHSSETYRLATLTYTRDSDRILSLWDRRMLRDGVATLPIDYKQSGIPLLQYHASQNLLMISSRPSESIHFIEVGDATPLSLLNTYTAPKPHRGCMMGTSTTGDLPFLYRATDQGMETLRLRRSEVLHNAWGSRPREVVGSKQQLPLIAADKWFFLVHRTSSTSSILPPPPDDTHSSQPSPPPPEPLSITSLLSQLTTALDDDVAIRQFLELDERTRRRQLHILTTAQALLMENATPPPPSTPSPSTVDSWLPTTRRRSRSRADDTLKVNRVSEQQFAESLGIRLQTEISSNDTLPSEIRIQQLEAKIQEYQTMLGAASLQQKRFVKQIAELERNGGERNTKKTSARAVNRTMENTPAHATSYGPQTCPRLNVGIEFGFKQMHQLIYMHTCWQHM